MATNAFVVIQNEDNTFDGISVNYDGYLEGVGHILKHYWQDPEEIKRLCKAKRYIRCLNETFDNTEFYPDEKSKEYKEVLNDMKKMDKDKFMNLSGNYCYTYLWTPENEWQVLVNDYEFIFENF